MKIDLPRHLYGALPELGQGAGSERLRLDLGRNLTLGLVDTLGRAIVTGRYEREAFPTEKALTQQFGVSFSVAREAVKMLTAKGLLSARPRQGTVPQPAACWNLFDSDVLHWLIDRPFSIELLRQFDQLRVAIEPEAAALAAFRATSEDHRRIAESLKRLVAQDDVLAARIAFHTAMLQASANPFYLQFRELVATALRSSVRLAGRLEGQPACLPDYACAGAAILRRDPEGARAAVRNLIVDIVAPGDAPAPGMSARRSES